MSGSRGVLVPVNPQMAPREDPETERKMQSMKAKEAADRILAYVYQNVGGFRARPPREAKQFAAAGLMRCCALLKGILVLDEARMPALAGILVRQHWETWLVSLYVLLGGDKALEVIVDDHTQWSRHLSKSLRIEGDQHHPDSVKKQNKLNYWEMHKRVIELLRERGEPVDGPAGVTGYDVIYRSESLFSTHANVFTIGRHLVCGDDEWAVSVDSSETRGDDVALAPVLYTNDLAQRVFKEFGLDGDAMAPFVADLA